MKDRKEYFKQYWAKHKKEHAEAQRRYVEKIGRKEYNEYQSTYRDSNPPQNKSYKEKCKEWYEKNREKKLEYQKQYKKSPMGRANNLLSAYKKSDIKYNRGECTLTAKWIVENIFSGQKCHYCDETDWHKLGCDRIDNTLPHTPDNVVPCCFKCNCKKH